MYQKVSIKKLSNAQISKLLNGHRIRVSFGNDHEIHASSEQHKKINKAHKKGCGVTIEFDPYQIEHHRQMRSRGEGFFGEIAKGALKTLAPIAIDAASKYAKQRIEGSALYPAGYGQGMFGDLAKGALKTLGPVALDLATNYAKKKIEGSGLRRRKVGRPRGKGMFGDLAKGALKTLGPIALDLATNYAKKKIEGSGVRRRKPRKGKGMFGDLAKGALKTLGPVALDLATNYAKKKIEGSGIRHQRALHY